MITFPLTSTYMHTVMAGEIHKNHLGVYKQSNNLHMHAKWLLNLEPVASRQEIDGAAQRHYSRIHLPQL